MASPRARPPANSVAPRLLSSLRTEDYHACVAQCSEVLREQPDNAKALFRRGRARRLLGQTEAAEVCGGWGTWET